MSKTQWIWNDLRFNSRIVVLAKSGFAYKNEMETVDVCLWESIPISGSCLITLMAKRMRTQQFYSSYLNVDFCVWNDEQNRQGNWFIFLQWPDRTQKNKFLLISNSLIRVWEANSMLPLLDVVWPCKGSLSPPCIQADVNCHHNNLANIRSMDKPWNLCWREKAGTFWLCDYTNNTHLVRSLR